MRSIALSFLNMCGYLRRILWLILWLILFVAILLLIPTVFYLINGGSLFGFNDNSNVPATNHTFNHSAFFSDVRGFSIDLVITIALAFALSAIILILFWMVIGINKPVIVPFYSNDKKLNGKAVSDMIVAELQRIKKIHSSSLDIPFHRSERLPVPPEKLDSIILAELDAASQNISASLQNVGKLSFSGLELQIDNFVMALNQHRGIRNGGCIINGNLQQDSSWIYMECHVKNKDGIINCEIKQKVREGSVIDVIRDMAFKISYELQEGKKLSNNILNNAPKKPRNNAYAELKSFFGKDWQDHNIGSLKKIFNITKPTCCPEGVIDQYFFSEDDLKPSRRLLNKLGINNHNLKDKFKNKLWFLNNHSLELTHSDQLKKNLANELNKLIFKEDLRCDPVVNSRRKRGETKKLINECEINKDRKGKCFHLNRLLLEDAFPSELKKFNENIIKSWEELKYFTEALNSYNQYMMTSDQKDLNDALMWCNIKNIQKIKNTIFRSMFYNIGICYFELGENVKAEKLFRKAVDVTPMVNAYCGQGLCLKYQQKFGEAIDAFRRAICYDSKLESPVTWYLLGAIYLDLGCYAYDLYDYAIAAYCEAINIDKNYPYPWMFLGITYYRKGKADLENKEKYNNYAIESIRKAIGLARELGLNGFPTQPVVLAAFLLQSGKKEDEIEAQKILNSSSLDDEYNAACLEALRNNVSESMNHLKKALENHRTNIIQARFDPDLSNLFDCSECSEERQKLFKDYPIDESIVKDIRKLLKELHEEDNYVRASFEAVCGNKEEAIKHLKEAFEDYKNNKGELCPNRFEQDQHFKRIRNIVVIIKNRSFDAMRCKIIVEVDVYNTCKDIIEDVWITVNRSDSAKKHMPDLDKRWTRYPIKFEDDVDKTALASRTITISVDVKGKRKNKDVSDYEQAIIEIRP